MSVVRVEESGEGESWLWSSEQCRSWPDLGVGEQFEWDDWRDRVNISGDIHSLHLWLIWPAPVTDCVDRPDWLLLLSWRSEAGQQLDMCQCDSAQLCRDQGWDTLSHSGAWSTLSPRHEWPGCGDQWHHDSELHQEEISTADQECSVIWSNLTCHSQHGRTETTQRK